MKKIIACIAALSLATMTLASCGSSDESSSDTTTTTTTAAEAEAAEESEAQEATEEEPAETESSEEETPAEEESEAEAEPAAEPETEYLYLVQSSWSGSAPTDKEEGVVKFMYDKDGNPKTAKGACDLNEWDTGNIKYNGEWAQYILTSDDLSDLSITFTVKTTDDTTWEYHTYDESKPAEDQVYQIFMTLDQTEVIDWHDVTFPEDTVNNSFATANENFEWTYTYDSSIIEAAIENGKAQLSENEDGTYTLGFNIQVGHIMNALVTGQITGTNLYHEEAAE